MHALDEKGRPNSVHDRLEAHLELISELYAQAVRLSELRTTYNANPRLRPSVDNYQAVCARIEALEDAIDAARDLEVRLRTAAQNSTYGHRVSWRVVSAVVG